MNQSAVWDRSAELDFTIYADNCGHNTLFPGANPGETVRVAAVALDDVIGGGVRVDVVKIDAEGSEPWILRGMRRIISENPRIRIFLDRSSPGSGEKMEDNPGGMKEVATRNEGWLLGTFVAERS